MKNKSMKNKEELYGGNEIELLLLLSLSTLRFKIMKKVFQKTKVVDTKFDKYFHLV
jgi:hypothetical protein